MAHFLRNAWYVAGLPLDIDDKPLGRTICGEAMVFYRADGGTATALEDFCPHRGAPLSLGRVVEGQLVCGYHGLSMGCEGKTIAMPGLRVQSFPAIRCYPVVERHGYIWVWPGEAALADAATVPACDWASDPEWAFGGGMFHVACDFRLMVDNLMDLSHENHVHATSIGQAQIDETPAVTRFEGTQVTTSRFMHQVQAPPFWQLALRGNHLADDQWVDRWQICHFSPPSQVMIEVGVALAGHGGHGAPADKKVSALVVDFITPETDGSIWYFWGMVRHFNPRDQALTAQIRDGQSKIFSEDLQMLERQQRNLQAQPERRLLKLKIDAGGVQARRVIERLLAEERGQQPPARPPEPPAGGARRARSVGDRLLVKPG